MIHGRPAAQSTLPRHHILTLKPHSPLVCKMWSMVYMGTGGWSRQIVRPSASHLHKQIAARHSRDVLLAQVLPWPNHSVRCGGNSVAVGGSKKMLSGDTLEIRRRQHTGENTDVNLLPQWPLCNTASPESTVSGNRVLELASIMHHQQPARERSR